MQTHAVLAPSRCRPPLLFFCRGQTGINACEIPADFIQPHPWSEQHGCCFTGMSEPRGTDRNGDERTPYCDSKTPLGNFVRQGDNQKGLNSHNCLYQPLQMVNTVQAWSGWSPEKLLWLAGWFYLLPGKQNLSSFMILCYECQYSFPFSFDSYLGTITQPGQKKNIHYTNTASYLRATSKEIMFTS